MTQGFRIQPKAKISYVKRTRLKEARNSFFGLGVYLLKSKFRIEDKLRFP